MMNVVAWCDNYNDNYPCATFTEERRRALVDRVKQRKYNMSYQMLSMNPYSTPVYQDGCRCLLSSTQWESVLSEVYDDNKRPPRFSPMDILTFKANDALWEREKFYREMAGENNGGG